MDLRGVLHLMRADISRSELLFQLANVTGAAIAVWSIRTTSRFAAWRTPRSAD
jgi:hypothetical protein